MVSRLRLQYCKVVIATSLVWFLVDVFLLMYFTDCTMTSQPCESVREVEDTQRRLTTTMRPPGTGEGFFNKFIPKVDNHSAAIAANHSPAIAAGHVTLQTLLQPRQPQGPGEMGKPVVIPEAQQAEMKEKFKINQFNLMASDQISINRTLVDVRMDSCKRKSYPTELLPTTSVVIVFHNEAWSTLLRTVHSVINRSPHHLLKEIILVDDASERDFLGTQLDNYVATLTPPVYVERMGQRSGLIRARLRGAGRAKGSVITFLDAHCECTEGWLEPLLFEIYKDRKSVVCPIIDVISDDTFEYITGSDMTWGGFNWKLNFRWYPVPQREMERRGGDRSLPLRSPTMAGGLFAMDRDYFYELGSYDKGMDIWGGENLEMSFRVWMCGGQVLISTCSRVGHVFRKVSPYSWPGGVAHILTHNTMRTVEIWMDDYKEFYYKISPGVKQTDFGDVTERRQLRETLQCKSFRWYLENIYPESQMPLDYYSLGEIRNKESGQCLDSMGRKAGEKVGMVGCHGMGGNQVFAYTMKKAIMIDDACLDLVARHGPIKLMRCHGMGGNQMFEFDAKSQAIRHVNSNQCLDKPGPSERDVPSISVCNGSPSQQWILSDLDWKKIAS